MANWTRSFTGSGRLLLPEPYDGPTPWTITVQDGTVVGVGAGTSQEVAGDVVDLGDALVTPGLVDAHTHPVYAGDRSDEAAARLAGEPYTGGGILRTVAVTRETADGELEALVRARLEAQLAGGTTTVECKSGYGLDTHEELRHLRLVTRVAAELPLRVVRTFLGAHAIPPNTFDYVDRVVDEMLPAVAAEGLAEFCDVFCDDGFFSVPDADRILSAAAAHGLGLRLHADQLSRIGAVPLGVRLQATSIDHLEQLAGDDIRTIAASASVATLLPGPALVMRDRLPPARDLLDAGATVALASDANAGTFGSWGSMPLVIGLGATVLGMTVAEAVAAATVGGAAALGVSSTTGRIAPGSHADLVAWDAAHEGAFALGLGGVVPRTVIVGGEVVSGP